MSNNHNMLLAGLSMMTAMLFISCGDGISGPTAPGSWYGWAVGEADASGGLVLRTSNGGVSWDRQISPAIGSVHLEDVHTVDSMCAWTVGFPSDGYGMIARTVDGGSSWQRLGEQGVIPFTGINAVHAFDRNTAWVIGDENTILHTTDAGENWISMSDPAYADFGYDDIYAYSANLIWIVGGDGNSGVILHSANGGSTWELQGSEFLLDSFPLINVSVVDDTTAWIVGHGHTVARTIDGGDTWELCVPDSLPRTSMSDDANGVVALPSGWVLVTMDYGKVYISENSGETWTKQDVPTAELLLGCCALDEQRTWAAAEAMNASGGCIIGTTNGGGVWGLQYSSGLTGVSSISIAGSQH